MPRLPFHRRQAPTDDSQSTTSQPLPVVIHDPEPQGGVSTVLIIQILIGVALVIGICAFLIQRQRRRVLERRRGAQRLPCMQISAPNGLDPGKRTIPPSYQEALRSPAVPVHFADAPAQALPRRQSELMDECMRAVYAQEQQQHDGSGYNLTHSTSASSQTGLLAGAAPPASPRAAARAERGTSMTRWLRNQRWIPGPLSSHPSSRDAPSSPLPSPPSPSYTGMTAPSTPRSVLLSPTTSSVHSSVPSSSMASVRDSIPSSVLYPAPLQPAPRGRRRENEDLPPQYEPRR